MNQEIKALGVAALTALAAITADAITITKGTVITRTSSFPNSLSGVTYAGGDTYYAVGDNKAECGLYQLTLTFSSDGKTITSCACVPNSSGSLKRTLDGADDIEGIAYDPGSGCIWVSDEKSNTTKVPTIIEYDPATGHPTYRTVPVPDVFKTKTRDNLAFESLTISGDGLTLWTANEEALTCDGPRSAYNVSSTNRLVKFTRATVHAPWQLSAMYPYITDGWHDMYGYGGKGRRGISDLCALPDGSLLVLERELSTDSSGTGLWALLGLAFWHNVYRITPSAMNSATDVKNFASLKNGGWSPVVKGSAVWTHDIKLGNYEGICLGKRLSATACELLMLTDGGDGNSNREFMPNVLSGLNVCTLNFEFNSPIGKSRIVGQNYRFLNGTVITNWVYGDGIEPRAYTNRGDYVSSSTWTLQNPSPTSGNGTKKMFTVTSDNTLTWNVCVSGRYGELGEDAPIFMHDTFEQYNLGEFDTAEVNNWNGYGEIVSGTPDSEKWILTRSGVAHEQVLDAENEVTREFSSAYMTASENTRMEIVVQVNRSFESSLGDPVGNKKLEIAANNEGQLCLWHRRGVSGHVASGIWSKLLDKKYDDGAWERIGVEIKYSGNRAFAQVFVNGQARNVLGGNVSPELSSSANSSGPWFPLQDNEVLAGLSLVGTKADDFIIAKPSFVQQLYPSASIMVSPTSGANVAAVAGGQAYTVATAVAAPTAASVAAASTQSSKTVVAPAITGFGFTPEKLPRIKFTGYVEGMTYRVLCSSSIDFANAKEIAGGVIDVKDDGEAVTAIWEGAEPDDPAAGAKFYRVEAIAGAGEAEF